MTTSLASNRGTLKQRAEMLSSVRAFFAEKNVLEVDTDLLSPYAPIDTHIDIMTVDTGSSRGYLHSSPEYAMKKLLANGSGDIYQLGHVFRANEEGPWHSGEFTMLEWYRVGFSLSDLIEETLDLIRLFIGSEQARTYTYAKVFQKFAAIDLAADLTPHVLSIAHGAETWDRDTQLQLLFSHVVEPKFTGLTVVTDFPAGQAALAKTHLVDGLPVAKRFEIFYDGIELANGFDELNDFVEQKKRLEEENQKRTSLGKEALAIDEEFILAVDSLPDCCGVAVGFDRLLRISAIPALSGSAAPR